MKSESKIVNSRVSKTAKLYRSVEVTNSGISDNSIVGDFSRIKNSVLHDFVRIDRQNLIFHSLVGAYSYTGRNDTIMHSQIGRFCSISWNVTIGGGEHDYNRLTTHDFLYNDSYGIRPKNDNLPYNRYASTCEIENDVWIGTGTVVLRGVTVGSGAVIGAGSIVTKNIPPYAIAVGNPAKVIKYRFEKNIIEELLKLEWWNLPVETIRSNFHLFTSKDIQETIVQIKNIKLSL